MRSIIRFAAALAALALAGTAAAQDHGAELFVKNGCYQCHGYQGQGGAAPRIAPTQYPLAAFIALVRRPASEMPAYSPRVLSDEVLGEIYAYVRSRPEPPPLSEIPKLRVR